MSRLLMLAAIAMAFVGPQLRAQSLPLPLDRVRSRNLFPSMSMAGRALSTGPSLPNPNLHGAAARLDALLLDSSLLRELHEWAAAHGVTLGMRRALWRWADSLRAELGRARAEASLPPMPLPPGQVLPPERAAAVDRDTQALFDRADAAATLYDSLAESLPPPRIPNGFFKVPIGSAAEARCFWRRPGAQVLSGVAAGFWKDRAAVAVEMYQSYYWGVRASFVTSLAASTIQEDTTGSKENANVQRFFAAGGNASLALAYPVLALSTDRMECDPAVPEPVGRALVTLQAILSPRLGFDAPEPGAAVDKVTGNIDLGADVRLSLSTADRSIAVLLQARPAWVFGTNSFYEGLSQASPGSFGYVLWTFGLFFRGQFGVTFTAATAPDSIRQRMGGAVSLSVRP